MTFTERIAEQHRLSPLVVLEYFQGRLDAHGDEAAAMVETRAHFAHRVVPKPHHRPRRGRFL